MTTSPKLLIETIFALGGSSCYSCTTIVSIRISGSSCSIVCGVSTIFLSIQNLKDQQLSLEQSMIVLASEENPRN